DGLSGTARMRLFKLAWDLCGDAFGQRALQYERYYAGDPVRLLAGLYQAHDSAADLELVDRALSLAGEEVRQ
ncbi:MAG: 4-hydroxyphenylacetate 3-hydroxylase C-terminal domain-containing protein, partial [Nocardioidaceae bacterium]